MDKDAGGHERERIMKGWMISGLLLLALSLMAPAHATNKLTLILTNAQGTVVAEKVPYGAVTYTAAYRPYGKQQVGTPQQGPGYTGHVNDSDTGLVYMQARYYDPSGRFLSVDPVGPSPGNIFSFNRYAYASNNPLINIDPDGRQDHPDYIDMDQLEKSSYELAPRGDLLRVVGNAIAADAAYVTGVVTGNDALKEAAVGGMSAHGGNGAALASICLMGRGGEGEVIETSGAGEGGGRPLIGRNAQEGGGRTNTDAGPNGNRATARSIFRNQAKGKLTATKMSNGGLRVRAENGVQIRYNTDGSARVDLPNRGQTPNGETLHTPPDTVD